jgi:gliding motility-associated-like protein
MPLADETYTVIGATSTCTNSAQVVITVTTNPVVSATNATICAGSSGTLTASGANSYTWSPATFLIPTTGASVTANPLSTKTYTVIGTSPLGCLGSTTAKVDVIPMPNLSITANPLSICPGDFSALTAFGASNFTWSPAATLSNTTGANTSASPTITTTYTLDGSNGVSPYLCLSTKTIQVIVKPTTTITVGTPAPICFGSYTSLDAHGGNMYNWQPSTGISHPNDSVVTVSPNVNTIYTVTVNKPGFCANTATVEVIVNPLPYVYAGIDTIVNIDEAVTLTGTGNTSVGFLSPDSYPLNCNLCPVITVNPQENTCFVLKGTSADGCTNFDTVCVVITKDWNVYIPNAFTPNNDGYNDLFIPYGYGIEKIQMTIFDRWGAVVFNSDDEHKGWDGKYKGTMCPQGIYVYQITVTSMGGASMKKVGHVTLLPLLK